MSLILKCRLKDRGDITWPPIPEPGNYSTEGSVESEARGRIEWLREQIRQACADSRDAFGSLPATRVNVSVTFRPDIMVDP